MLGSVCKDMYAIIYMQEYVCYVLYARPYKYARICMLEDVCKDIYPRICMQEYICYVLYARTYMLGFVY